MKERPIMRYHGGKFRLALWIISHFPPHRLYVEPFGGAASVLLRKSLSPQEVYNDLDGEIVNVFRVLRDPILAAELSRLLFLTPHSRAEFLDSYAPAGDPVEQARRTLVRAEMGHGSASATRDCVQGFRFSRNGRHRLAQNWSNYPAHVQLFVKRLRLVTLEQRPALDILQQYDSPNTLFYVDPPYLPETREASSSKRGYRFEMTPEEHRELAMRLQGVQGMVILSGYDNALYREVLTGWAVSTHHAIADKGKPRTECLWISPKAVAAIPQKILLEVV